MIYRSLTEAMAAIQAGAVRGLIIKENYNAISKEKENAQTPKEEGLLTCPSTEPVVRVEVKAGNTVSQVRYIPQDHKRLDKHEQSKRRSLEQRKQRQNSQNTRDSVEHT